MRQSTYTFADIEKKSSFSAVFGLTFFMMMSATSADAAWSVMYLGWIGLHLLE